MTTRLTFEEARQAYPGTKNGLEQEFGNFVDKGKKPKKNWPKYNPDEVVRLLMPAIKKQIEARRIDQKYWKNFQTWINQQCWTEENPQFKKSQQISESIENRSQNDYEESTRNLFLEWGMEKTYEYCIEKNHRRGKILAAKLWPKIIEYAKKQKVLTPAEVETDAIVEQFIADNDLPREAMDPNF